VRRFLPPFVLVALLCEPAFADSIDLASYLARLPVRHYSGPHIVAGLLALMVINYAVNYLVIGLPAICFARADRRAVTVGLIWLTLLGQIADRVGALVALFLFAPPLARMLGIRSVGAWMLGLLAMNFLCSAIAVGALALYFLRRRWKVRPGLAWGIAVTAAVLTNPVWGPVVLSLVPTLRVGAH
jgi:hypothetical protein